MTDLVSSGIRSYNLSVRAPGSRYLLTYNAVQEIVKKIFTQLAEVKNVN
jgi:hypothetical protein